MSGPINHFSDLIVYQKAFGLSMRVFELSRNWPVEERYALTDQVRRSSRSVGANIAEAWAKRRYGAHFVSKLSDSDAELHETEHWLMCALKHGYLARDDFASLSAELTEVGKMLGSMIRKPDSFLIKTYRIQATADF
jgi:four helix bundle protein